MAKKQFLSLGFFIGSILFAVAMLYFPVLSLMSIFMSVICFSLSIIFTPRLWTIGVCTPIVFLFVWLISGRVSAALLFTIIFLPVGLALGLGLRKKKSFNDIVSFSTLNIAIIGILFFIVFIGELSNGSFNSKEALEPIFLEIKAALVEVFSVEDSSVNSFLLSYGVSSEQYVNAIFKSFVYNIPTFYVVFMLALSVSCYWVLKVVMKRTAKFNKIPDNFDCCRISYVGAISYFASTFLYLFTSDSVFGMVISNFSNIMTYVFAYAGISVIAYFLNFKKVSSVLKYGLLIFAFSVCLLPVGALNLVALIGVVDSYWDIRKRLGGYNI